MDDSFVLFNSSKRLTVRLEDMTVAKIGRIFQVANLYLTDDHNVAVFPGQDGHFSSLDLKDRGHYEVHGLAETSSQEPLYSSPCGAFRFPSRSASASSSAAAASPSFPPRAQSPKYFQRTVSLGEFRNGKFSSSRLVVVRFTEQEANVPIVTKKVADALGSEEPLVLTDSCGNEILDSEGTRGSYYWKQNSRKIMAVPAVDFQVLQQKRRKTMHKDDGSELDGVYAKIEEVVLAAQGLTEVTSTIQGLTDLINRNRRTTVVITEEQSRNLRDIFSCLVCKGPMQDPIFSLCCESLIGCKSCVDMWLQNSSQCLKCRAEEFPTNVHRVLGLGEVVDMLGEVVRAE